MAPIEIGSGVKDLNRWIHWRMSTVKAKWFAGSRPNDLQGQGQMICRVEAKWLLFKTYSFTFNNNTCSRKHFLDFKICIFKLMPFLCLSLAGIWCGSLRPQGVTVHPTLLILQQTCSSLLLHQLHWLPIEFRIKFKVACLTYKTLSILPRSLWSSNIGTDVDLSKISGGTKNLGLKRGH